VKRKELLLWTFATTLCKLNQNKSLPLMFSLLDGSHIASEKKRTTFGPPQPPCKLMHVNGACAC